MTNGRMRGDRYGLPGRWRQASGLGTNRGCAIPAGGYRLTSEPVQTAQEAWKGVLAYARRGQIEMAFRLTKSERAMQSPRLGRWEGGRKPLWMLTRA